MPEALSVGILGCGYWGAKLARAFDASPFCRLRAVADPDRSALRSIALLNADVEFTSDPFELVSMTGLDAIVVATPIPTHFRLAAAALENGKHVLVEKPLTDSTETAQELVATADKKNLKVVVDHTFVYSEPVRQLKAFIDDGALGELLYIESRRFSLRGPVQRNASVLDDLAVHDFAICDFFLKGEIPDTVSAFGANKMRDVPTVCHTSLLYHSGEFAHVAVSWVSPAKVRELIVAGSKKIAVYDGCNAPGEIRLYDNGHDTAGRFDLSLPSVLLPLRNNTEALVQLANEFSRTVTAGADSPSNGAAGVRVVRMIAAADQSMKRQGVPASLSSLFYGL